MIALQQADVNFPQLDRYKDTDQKFNAVLDYLYILDEELRHTLSSLGPDNFSAEGELRELSGLITEPVYIQLENEKKTLLSSISATAEALTSRMQDVERGLSSEIQQTAQGFRAEIAALDGRVTTIQATADSLAARVKDNEGNISSLTQTASALTARVQNAEGNVSSLRQDVNGFETRVQNAEGNISSLRQTVHGFESRVQNAEGMASRVQQTVNGLAVETYAGMTTIGGDHVRTDNLFVKNIYGQNPNLYTGGYTDAIDIKNSSGATVGQITAEQGKTSLAKVGLYGGAVEVGSTQGNIFLSAGRRASLMVSSGTDNGLPRVQLEGAFVVNAAAYGRQLPPTGIDGQVFFLIGG